jgi:hypothetical protein
MSPGQPHPRRRRIRAEGGGKHRRGVVLAHVAGVEPGGDDAVLPRRAQRRHVRRAQRLALLQLAIGQAERMGQDRALGLIEGHGTEAHQPCLSRWVIWAMTEIAISAGDFAPISRPTGAWILPISASVKPFSVSRATRLAWVRVDPRQPR